MTLFMFSVTELVILTSMSAVVQITLLQVEVLDLGFHVTQFKMTDQKALSAAWLPFQV